MLKRSLAVLVTLVLAVAVAACGGDEEQAAQEGGEDTTKLKVGVIPITPVAPVYLGIEEGFFEEEGLEVEPQPAQGGAAIVPAVQSGDVDLGFSNSVSLMIGQTTGLPVRVIAPGEISPSDPEDDNTAIMVPKNSPIQSPQDLEGKTIGVNTLQNIAGLTTEVALDKEGVDVDTLKLVEVPFPEMLSAVQGGEVDAGFFNEPFTTLAEKEGARTIIRPYTATEPDLPIAPYFTLASNLEENPEVYEAFRRAMEKSTQFALDNPDAVRKIIPTYSEIPRDVAQEIRLPFLGTEVQPDRYERLADLAQEFGYTDQKADVSELLSEEAQE